MDNHGDPSVLKPKKPFGSFFWVWSLALITLFGLVAFSLKIRQNKTLSLNKVFQSLPGQVADIQNWQEFINAKDDYTLKYPFSWFYRGESMGVHVISNQGVNYPELTKDGVVVSIFAQEDKFLVGGTDYRTAKETFEKVYLPKAKESLKIDGYPAVKQELNMARNQKWNQLDDGQKFGLSYLVLKDNTLYRLVLDGPKNQAVRDNELVFDQVAQSLVFSETEK